ESVIKAIEVEPAVFPDDPPVPGVLHPAEKQVYTQDENGQYCRADRNIHPFPAAIERHRNTSCGVPHTCHLPLRSPEKGSTSSKNRNRRFLWQSHMLRR